ncbi:MAG: sec-independent protein translocase protein TatC [Acidobacteriota bacterium]|nr:sec-independent protein translocase protein TatC [Acidobacteriota bacterium]
MATLLGIGSKSRKKPRREEPGGQMSFLNHLDELRGRIIRSVAFVFVAFVGCWFVSDYIYNFLALPIQQALAEAQRNEPAFIGMTGQETILPNSALKEADTGRYVFGRTTKLGSSVIPEGTSVSAKVGKDQLGRVGLFTDEALFAGETVIPKGVMLPFDFNIKPKAMPDPNAKLVVTTAMEPFSLYVEVSIYAALALAVPFILWQIWAFVSPGLYPHERRYALPFVLLSTISFVIGGAFAYKIIFPPAAKYLLGLGEDFRLFLNASDYFDFIILIMLAMGVVFQMPAITYVLSRIGIISAKFLIRHWKGALIVILIAAAVLSPTNDVPNMLLFAAPMILLYVVSVFIAWIFGKERKRA